MTNDSFQNNKKRTDDRKLGQDQQNEFPRQGNENPEIGLVGDAGMEKKENDGALTVGDNNTLEKEGEILGKEVQKRIKDSKEGVASNSSPSEE